MRASASFYPEEAMLTSQAGTLVPTSSRTYYPLVTLDDSG